MKISDLASKYGINIMRFSNFLKQASYKTKEDPFTSELKLDKNESLDVIVADFKQYEAETDAQRKEEILREELTKAEKEAALANILITSGFNFDGYTITKYSGYISIFLVMMQFL